MRVFPADLFQANDTPPAAEPQGLGGASSGTPFDQFFATASRQAFVGGPSGRDQRQTRLEDPAGSVAGRQETETLAEALEESATENGGSTTSADVGAASPGVSRTNGQVLDQKASDSGGGAGHSDLKNHHGSKTPLSPNPQMNPSTARQVTDAKGAAMPAAAQGSQNASIDLPDMAGMPSSVETGKSVGDRLPAPSGDPGNMTTQKVALDSARLTSDTFSTSGDSTPKGGQEQNHGAPGNLNQDGPASATNNTNSSAVSSSSAVMEPIMLPESASQAAEIKVASVMGAMSGASATSPASSISGESPLPEAPHLTEQVGRALRTVVQQRGGSMTIRLNPPEMGMVRIQVRMEGNVVHAQFEVTSEAVKTLLQQQMSQLKEALGQQGLTAEQLHVSHANASGPSHEADDPDVTDDGRSRGKQNDENLDSDEVPEGDSDDGFEQKLMDLMA